MGLIETEKRLLPANPMIAGLAPGVATTDRIAWVRLSSVTLPLHSPISDAKVLTGRQKPMTKIAFLFAEIETEEGYSGIGFSYSKRAGGPGQYMHAKEVADELIGEDPNDIARLWDKLVWAGASVGRSGLSTQAIAAFDIALWDLKAKRADLPLAKLLGAYRDSVQCYNTSGGFLSMDIGEVKERVSVAIDKGIGGIKLKVGQPDPMIDLKRIDAASSGSSIQVRLYCSTMRPKRCAVGRSAIRDYIGGNVPLMIDANQQWVRCGGPCAAGRGAGHADRHRRDADQRRRAFRADPGITGFLKICALAEHKRLRLAPHFAMEIHLHLSAAYAHEPWVEHFEWLEPMFNERLEIKDGRMIVPNRPGLGFSLSEQAAAWTTDQAEFGRRP